jgi:hypothetical protein
MTPNSQVVVIGVFADSQQAAKALDHLLQAGFSEKQFYFAGQPLTPIGMLTRFQSLFSRQQLPSGGGPEELVRLGVPQAQARSYYQAYEAGNTIVVTLAQDRGPEALDLLRRAGGSVAQYG